MNQPEVRRYTFADQLNRSDFAKLRSASDFAVYVVLPSHNASESLPENLGLRLRPLLQKLPDEDASPINQVIVVDDNSTDHTGEIATRAGGSVIYENDASGVFDEIVGREVTNRGKGCGMALGGMAALAYARRDGYEPSQVVLVFLDANIGRASRRRKNVPDDVTGPVGFSPDHVLSLGAPIMSSADTDAPIKFVQGFSRRFLRGEERGGRVRAGYVRPLILDLAATYPQLGPLTNISGPTNGEVAMRGDAFLYDTQLGAGYSVEMWNLVSMFMLPAFSNGLRPVAQAENPARFKENPRPDDVPVGSSSPRGSVTSQGLSIVRSITARFPLGEHSVVPHAGETSHYAELFGRFAEIGEPEAVLPKLGEIPNWEQKIWKVITRSRINLSAEINDAEWTEQTGEIPTADAVISESIESQAM